jgi:hypothetical protein
MQIRAQIWTAFGLFIYIFCYDSAIPLRYLVHKKSMCDHLQAAKEFSDDEN